MKKAIVAAALGFGMMVGSLAGISEVGAAPAGGGKALSAYNYACTCGSRITTSSLNLRSGAGTNYDVITVMPAGAEVLIGIGEGSEKNGFIKTRYNETWGWASLDYLAIEDDGYSGDNITSGAEYDIVGTGITTDRVNFRRGAGFDYSAQSVIEAGAQVAYSDMVLNGFRYVWHAGVDGWVYDEYLDLDGSGGQDDAGAGGGSYEPGSTMTTTSRLNLRMLPSTSSEVLLVMPEGAKVTVHAESENGFVTVTYNGTTGWAYLDYLT